MKSSEDHKRDGTYREDRQGGRMEDGIPCESPVCPGWLSPNAKALFLQHCKVVPLKYQTALDGPILAMAALAASEMSLCAQSMENYSNDSKQYASLQRRIINWARLLETGSNHLGWSPKSRMKIRTAQQSAAKAPSVVEGLRSYQESFSGN